MLGGDFNTWFGFSERAYAERRTALGEELVRGTFLRGIVPELEDTVADLGRNMRRGELASLKPGEYNIILGAAQSFHDHRLFRRAGTVEFGYLEAVGEQAFRVYDQPDAGMWELRTRARIHTSSALMSWAACDRLAKIAGALGLPERVRHWRVRADEIRTRVLKESWSEQRQAFAESFGGRDLDASALLMAEVNMIDPNDPRFVSTVNALERSLCDGPYMRRYEAADDFGKPETAFNICTFWRIDALARIGRKGQAREIFEVMLGSRNPLGLLSEDMAFEDGEA